MNSIAYKYTFVILGLLAIPFIAMQFTDEVDWGLGDFIIAFALLASLSLIIEFMRTRIPSKRLKNMAIGIIVLLFLLIWMEMAVGIFGSPIAGS